MLKRYKGGKNKVSALQELIMDVGGAVKANSDGD